MFLHAVDVGALIGGAAVSAFVAWLAWRQRTTRGNMHFFALMVALSFYSLMLALELLGPDLQWKILCSKAQYLGNANLAPLWLLFVLAYGGLDLRLTPRRLALLWLIPAASILLVATNEWHGWAWPSVRLEGHSAVYEHGPVVWLVVGYSYLLMGLASAILIGVAMRSSRVYLSQAAVLLVAATLPWSAHIMYMCRFEPFNRFDSAPLFFALSGVLLAWARVRLRLFRLTPVAHAAILSNMGEGLVILDDRGCILDINPAGERLLGVSRDRIGEDLAAVAPQAAALAAGNRGAAAAVTLPGRDGSVATRWIEAGVTDLPGVAHRSRCRMMLLRDVTERKALAEQLMQAQKLESIGRLAGGIAHDFNNMLAAILCYSDLALCQIGPDHPLYPDLREIEKAAHRSAELTQQLLAFGRKQIVSPRVIDLSEVAAADARMLARLVGSKRTLETRLADDLWPVRVDPVQIDQVIANLVVNARDAIPEAGVITVSIENVTLDEGDCRHRPDSRPGDFVRLSVSDTGVGMSPEVLDHIFEPFFTTKERGKGTGLGLPSVYGIAQQNHGFIEVASEVGLGTTIRVYLPRYTGPDPDGMPDECVPESAATLA